MKWIDFKTLERDDIDEKFGLFEFIFYNNRECEEKWWYIFIPLLNFIYGFYLAVVLITTPIRIYIHINQTNKLRKYAYDIEDTWNKYRLIRSINGDLGLCEWGLPYAYSRKVLLETKYKRIDRWKNDGYIVTNKQNKMGLYDASKNNWIFPCECKQIKIESDNVIVVITNNHSQRYNIHGDRILN